MRNFIMLPCEIAFAWANWPNSENAASCGCKAKGKS